ncbi:MAG TPA: rhodanese-like domain-containing protein [Candidatus Limnocylindrales bacterium]|jgi:thiosulfate/3-mercaptopyruvate sulfurtransferase
MNGYPRAELIATPEWLAENLGRPGFQVLDVRWRPDGSGKRAYGSGHIPGASYLDWRAELVEPDDDGDVLQIAGPSRLTGAMARAGLGNGMVGVLYDDTAAAYAAWAWWTLRVYGLESARILNGGLDSWLTQSRPMSGGQELRPPAIFTPHLEARLQVTATEVRDMLGSPTAQILDARTQSEYLGHSGTSRRLGHIPGAINVPAAAATEPGTGCFRSADGLRALLRGAQVDPRRRLVCYDSAGPGAAKLAFVLCLLGYEDIAVYCGGWAEWGDRLDLPVER